MAKLLGVLRWRWKVSLGSSLALLTVLFIYLNTRYVAVCYHLVIVLLALLVYSWFLERPLVLFLISFPALVAIWFTIPFIGSFIEPVNLLSNPNVGLIALGLIMLVAFVEFVVVLLLLLTGRIARALLTRQPCSASPTFSILVQSYLGIILAMSTFYMVLEWRSDGKAFAGMYPKGDTYEYREDPFGLRLDALYFSTLTSATVGYGDIYPISGVAKMLVIFHVLSSQFIVIVLLALTLSRFAPRGS